MKHAHPNHPTSGWFRFPDGDAVALTSQKCWSLRSRTSKDLPRWESWYQTSNEAGNTATHFEGVSATSVNRYNLASIRDFETFWNSLEALEVVTPRAGLVWANVEVTDNMGGVGTPSPPVAELQASTFDLVTQAGEERNETRYSAHFVRYEPPSSAKNYFASSKPMPDQELEASQPFSGQAEFLVAHGLTWNTGPFQFVFPSLYNLPREYKTMDFGTLGNILSRESSAPDATFELFGTKVPERYLLAWGMPILALVQLYLLLHLRAAEGLGLFQMDVRALPWIALYHDGLSRFVTLASLGILPVSVAFLLLQRHVNSVGWGTPLGLASVACATIVAGLGAISARTIVILTGRRRKTSTNNFE